MTDMRAPNKKEPFIRHSIMLPLGFKAIENDPAQTCHFSSQMEYAHAAGTT
ncbi:MAG: hypothetical protein LBQ39_05185 [Tannerellaceae bacterium]|jgi:hypothetical protein|nr:hypothetical protein [Tannerellaceae bacterium]